MTAKKRHIAVLDIETLDGLKGCKFAIGCFYTIQRNKDCFIIEKNSETLFEKIFEYSVKNRTLCFIQNEDFDIRFLLKYCIDKLDIYPVVKQSNSKIFEVEIKELNIIFRDSLQFLLCSQAKAEETFLRKKIKKEVDFVNVLRKINDKFFDQEKKKKLWEELEERVKSDCVGLFEVMKKVRELAKIKFGLDLFQFVTLPAFVIQSFAKKLKEDSGESLIKINPYMKFENFKYKWTNEKLKNLYYWTRQSYYGGRCEVFNLDYLEKIYYYDYASLYPSECITKKFPNPSTYFMLEFPDVRYFMKHIHKKYQYIIEAKVKEDIQYPILPIRDTENVKFVNGEKIGTWASPIFDRFLEFKENGIIEIINIRIYEESEYYFKNFMNDRFENRKKYKDVGDSANEQIEKLIMNSLTGKPAQIPIRESWVLFNHEAYNDILHANQPIEIIAFTEKYR